MSFATKKLGFDLAAGCFLTNDENCERVTCKLDWEAEIAESVDVRKIVYAGTVYPKNDYTARGFIYEAVDVTDGDALASLVTRGNVTLAKLPGYLEDDAKTALKARGFVFTDEENETPEEDETPEENEATE